VPVDLRQEQILELSFIASRWADQIADKEVAAVGSGCIVHGLLETALGLRCAEACLGKPLLDLRLAT
jgi:hypothetical protein